MSDYKSIAAQFGLNSEELDKAAITARPTFYEHDLGAYQGIVLDAIYKAKLEGKTVEINTPGAVPYGQLRIAIFQDPAKLLIDPKTLLLTPGIEYGRFVFNQYISLDETKQFANRSLFEDFTIEGFPDLSIVKENEDKTYQIRLGLLIAYYGAPVTFTLTRTLPKDRGLSKSAFLTQLTLVNHSLTKESLAKRKIVADKIREQLEALKDKESAKKDSVETPAPPSPESALDEYIL